MHKGSSGSQRRVIDAYIDNIVSLTIDLQDSNNSTRLGRAILLAIHISAWPKYPSGPILREEMAAFAKILAEAKL